MLLGVHEPADHLARTAVRFPLAEVTREFVNSPIKAQSLVPKLINTCVNRQGPSVRRLVWSFKPDVADVNSGAWKPYIEELAYYIRDNHLESSVIICIWHEPENDVPKYFKTPEKFVRLFDTVHDWLKNIGPDIQTTHAALGYQYSRMTDPVARRWVTKADIHSIDIYSGRSFPLDMTLGTSEAFKRWKDSRPAGSSWGVSERGWIADAAHSAERAASIQQEAAYLAGLPVADRPVFYIVWNTPGTENDPQLVLDAAAEDAVNSLFGALSRTLLARMACPLCSGSGNVEPRDYVIVRAGE